MLLSTDKFELTSVFYHNRWYSTYNTLIVRTLIVEPSVFYFKSLRAQFDPFTNVISQKAISRPNFSPNYNYTSVFSASKS